MTTRSRMLWGLVICSVLALWVGLIIVMPPQSLTAQAPCQDQVQEIVGASQATITFQVDPYNCVYDLAFRIYNDQPDPVDPNDWWAWCLYFNGQRVPGEYENYHYQGWAAEHNDNGVNSVDDCLFKTGFHRHEDDPFTGDVSIEILPGEKPTIAWFTAQCRSSGPCQMGADWGSGQRTNTEDVTSITISNVQFGVSGPRSGLLMNGSIFFLEARPRTVTYQSVIPPTPTPGPIPTNTPAPTPTNTPPPGATTQTHKPLQDRDDAFEKDNDGSVIDSNEWLVADFSSFATDDYGRYTGWNISGTVTSAFLMVTESVNGNNDLYVDIFVENSPDCVQTDLSAFNLTGRTYLANPVSWQVDNIGLVPIQSPDISPLIQALTPINGAICVFLVSQRTGQIANLTPLNLGNGNESSLTVSWTP